MNRKLFALIRDNAERKSEIRSEVDGDTATIFIYGVIDPYWGICAQDVATMLASIKTPKIDLRINTGGGDVFEARAIMTLLTQHPATITAKIDGIAASAGSVIALAAETVEIAEGGFYMIHKGWTCMMGNADDLRTIAGLLDKVDAAMITDYVAKSGKAATEIEAWMKAETWFDAQEAVEAGFCNSVVPTTAAGKASATAKANANAKVFNLSAYANAPKALTEQTSDDDAAEHLRAVQASRLGLYERTAA